MSTLRQKELAKNIIENIRKKTKRNKKELAVLSGYSESHATKHPSLIYEAKGLKKELETKGFSEEGAKEVVQEILYDDTVDAGDRIRAAQEVFKVSGTYAPEKKLSATVDISELQRQITVQIALFRGVTNGFIEPKDNDNVAQ